MGKYTLRHDNDLNIPVVLYTGQYAYIPKIGTQEKIINGATSILDVLTSGVGTTQMLSASSENGVIIDNTGVQNLQTYGTGSTNSRGGWTVVTGGRNTGTISNERSGTVWNPSTRQSSIGIGGSLNSSILIPSITVNEDWWLSNFTGRDLRTDISKQYRSDLPVVFVPTIKELGKSIKPPVPDTSKYTYIKKNPSDNKYYINDANVAYGISYIIAAGNNNVVFTSGAGLRAEEEITNAHSLANMSVTTYNQRYATAQLASRRAGDVELVGNFELAYAGPLDARTVTPTRKTLVDPEWWLTANPTRVYLYNGMVVAIRATQELVMYRGGDVIISDITEKSKKALNEDNWTLVSPDGRGNTQKLDDGSDVDINSTLKEDGDGINIHQVEYDSNIKSSGINGIALEVTCDPDPGLDTSAGIYINASINKAEIKMGVTHEIDQGIKQTFSNVLINKNHLTLHNDSPFNGDRQSCTQVDLASGSTSITSQEIVQEGNDFYNRTQNSINVYDDSIKFDLQTFAGNKSTNSYIDLTSNKLSGYVDGDINITSKTFEQNAEQININAVVNTTSYTNEAFQKNAANEILSGKLQIHDNNEFKSVSTIQYNTSINAKTDSIFAIDLLSTPVASVSSQSAKPLPTKYYVENINSTYSDSEIAAIEKALNDSIINIRSFSDVNILSDAGSVQIGNQLYASVELYPPEQQKGTNIVLRGNQIEITGNTIFWDNINSSYGITAKEIIGRNIEATSDLFTPILKADTAYIGRLKSSPDDTLGIDFGDAFKENTENYSNCVFSIDAEGKKFEWKRYPSTLIKNMTQDSSIKNYLLSTPIVRRGAEKGANSWDEYNMYMGINQNVYFDQHGDLFATNYYQSSDINLKTDITRINHIPDLQALPKAKDFVWKDDVTSKKTTGYIAQELIEQGFDRFVVESDEFLRVNYNALLSYQIEILKQYLIEAYNKIAELENKINS